VTAPESARGCKLDELKYTKATHREGRGSLHRLVRPRHEERVATKVTKAQSKSVQAMAKMKIVILYARLFSIRAQAVASEEGIKPVRTQKEFSLSTRDPNA
jgi:hypothetical protein